METFVLQMAVDETNAVKHQATDIKSVILLIK